MIEIETPEIRVGKNESGEYAEIVIPEEFNPGSIMVFATDMDVSPPPPLVTSLFSAYWFSSIETPLPVLSYSCWAFIRPPSHGKHVSKQCTS